MVCRDDVANADLLRELLQQTLTANFDEISLDAVTYNVRFTLQRRAPDLFDENGQPIHRIICGFELLLPEGTAYLATVLKDFSESLFNTDGVDHVLKFYDDNLLEQNAGLMHELFALEMKLRKALSLIYLAAYRDDYYNLLRDESVKAFKKDGQKLTEAELKEPFENEFFHLLFSQYINLNKRPNPKPDDILNLLRDSDSFDTIKLELTRIPIEDGTDSDLIASLKQMLDPIEKLRNCVAHNRTPTDRIIQNYRNAHNELDRKLDEFLALFTLEQAEGDD
jgi:hypothetical protein